MTEVPANMVEMINARLGGYSRAAGLRFVSATLDELVAELEVNETHLQPYGLVHGGVLAGMIETACSTGAAINVFAGGRSAVGLENATSFLRAVRSGVLRCTARPLMRGKRSHVWQAEVTDAEQRLVASGRVRLLILESGAVAGGGPLSFDAVAGGGPLGFDAGGVRDERKG